MQVVTAKEITCAEEGKVSYEIQWTIPNWRQVRQDVNLVKNQKATFETGVQSTQLIQTKWLVGFKVKDTSDGGTRVRVYWQLLDIKGSGSLLKLDVKTETKLCGKSRQMTRLHEIITKVGLGEVFSSNDAILEVGPDVGNGVDNAYINEKGAIEYTLSLTFKALDINSNQKQFKRLKMEQFFTRSHKQLRENQAALLNLDSNGDLKIVTKDGVKLSAHQSILKAQCPVFAGMLNSNLSERKTGIVKVEDISGKTMKMLLHYFYTGDLPNGWDEPNTIVEFTYAAGKYQMTQVLDLLDDLFGRGDAEEVSNLDVQLLNLAGKLSLKNAEKRLLQQIIGKVVAAKSGEDLFELFGYDTEEIVRKAGVQARETIGESKVLKIWDYTVGNTDHKVDFSEGGLVLLAFVQRDGGLKGLEQILLKQIAEISRKFTTAEELINFFGGGV